MYKKIGMLGLILTSNLVYALSSAEKEVQEKENIKLLQQAGIMTPESGISIVPRATLNLSEKSLRKFEQADKERATLGYINRNNARSEELMNIQREAKKSFQQFKTPKADESTDLRHNVSEIKMAFEFKGIPKSLITTYIGVAPQGSFNENGWSGAAEFFTKDNIGNCSYGQMSIKVSHLSAQLASESVSYDVNNKISVIEIAGNKKHGFIYNVKWFDEDYFHELECANANYSANTTTSVIDLARRIDSNA